MGMTANAQLGVLHASGIAEALASIGVSAVGAGTADLRSAVGVIGEHFKTHGLVPLVSIGDHVNGKQAWLTRAVANGAKVIILAGENPIEVPGAIVIDLPTTLANVLSAAGLDSPLGASEITVEKDGSTTTRAVSAPAVDLGDLDDIFDTPAAEPAPMPPVSTEDSWGEMPTPAPIPATEPAPAPAPMPQPAPYPSPAYQAPAPSPTPAPTPRYETPSAVPAPMPSYEAPPERVTQTGADGTVYVLNARGDGWDVLTPAPSNYAQQAPAYEAPRGPEPQPVYQQPGQPQVDQNTQMMAAYGAPRQRTHGEKCPSLYVFAAKGGAFKTTTALQLAQRAAKHGGLKVVLVDMNRGQGGTRVLMRLVGSNMPTVFDYASRSDVSPAQVVVGPEVLNNGRSTEFDRVEFSAAFAPPDTVDDVSYRLVTAQSYADVIEYARTIADLVIVDTQTLDSVDSTGLIDNVMAPALAGGAWGLALTDSGAEGATFLVNRLAKFSRRGSDQGRILLAVTKVDPSVARLADVLLSEYASMATPLGPIIFDRTVEQSLSSSKFAEDSEAVVGVIDAALYRVTGNPRFNEPHVAPTVKRKKMGLFGFGAK